MELADPGRVLFGSDFPFSRHRSPAQDVRSVIAAFEAFDGWDDDVRRGIESGNALQLFPRLAQSITALRECAHALLSLSKPEGNGRCPLLALSANDKSYFETTAAPDP